MARSTVGNPVAVALTALVVAGGCASAPSHKADVAAGTTADRWVQADEQLTTAVRRAFGDGAMHVLGVWWDRGRLLAVVDQGRYHGLSAGEVMQFFDEQGFEGRLEFVRVDATSAIAEVHIDSPGAWWPL